MRVDNTGTQDISTTLHVTHPESTALLHETFVTPARNVVERVLRITAEGTYAVNGEWPGGSGKSTLTSNVNTTECPTLKRIEVTLPVNASNGGIRVGPSKDNCMPR